MKIPCSYVAASILLASQAIAHEGMHGPGAEYDADEDGMISPAEYAEYLKASKQDVNAAAAKFAQLDKDKNGYLTSAEFIMGLPKKPAS